MKTNCYKIIIIGVLIATCISATLIKKEKDKGNIQWGSRWAHVEETDSSYLHAQGIKADSDCFPESDIFETDSSSAKMHIYNRWGNLLYNSLDSNVSWICNSGQNLNTHKEGTYFWVLFRKSKLFDGQMDTLQGQITLYRIN